VHLSDFPFPTVPAEFILPPKELTENLDEELTSLL